MKLMIVLSVAACASAAGAEPYWTAWEGDDFPENEGWTRVWFNQEGAYGGDGAVRTLEDGVLTIDSLYDPYLSDFHYIEGNSLDPGPDELFVMEWRLNVEVVAGPWHYDPAVGLDSDTGWTIGFRYAEDRIVSVFEDDVSASIAPGVFHAYRLQSWNMLTYELYIDGELAIEGSFWESVSQSYVGWGDGVRGSASLTHWDYFRFGAVPEPSCFTLVLSVVACCVGRRR